MAQAERESCPKIIRERRQFKPNIKYIEHYYNLPVYHQYMLKKTSRDYEHISINEIFDRDCYSNTGVFNKDAAIAKSSNETRKIKFLHQQR